LDSNSPTKPTLKTQKIVEKMKAKIINFIKRLLSKLPTPTFSTRNFALVILLVLGLLGNYLHLPLLFGLDFLFGSIAVFIIIELYGIFWGILAATIASSYTFLLWGHPYAGIIFIWEAVFVSLLRKRKGYSLLLLDGIYWLCLGMPLIFLFYQVTMQTESTQVWLVLFKQPVNGIFNALVASLLLSYPPIFRNLGGSKFAREFSLKESLIHLLVAFVFFPSLIVMLLDSRSFINSRYKHIETDLTSLSSRIETGINLWSKPYEKGIEKLSQIALESNLQPSAKLQSAVEVVVATLPDLDSLSVTGVDGSKVASYAENSTVSNLDNLTCSRQFKIAVSGELLEINRPLLRENNFLGCLEAKINLNSIDRLLEENFILVKGNKSASYLPLELTLIDSSDKAIATSREYLEPNSQYNLALPAQTTPLSPTILQWVPYNQNRPTMVRWQQSLFLQKTPFEQNQYLQWSLVAELPTASIINYLHGIYIRHLGTILLIGCLAISSAIIISKKLLKPIENLAVSTGKLPENASNVEFMAASIEKKFTELNRANQQLNLENAERKQEQNTVEELNENLEERVKERTAELERYLAQLQGLIQNIKAGILVENENGYITLVNQEFCHIFALPFPPETLIGTLCADAANAAKELFLNPDEFIARIEETLQQKIPILNEELQLRDGRTLERDYIPVTVSGKFYGNLWLYRDISNRKQVEIETQTALERETELNQLKSRFISMTSHEFRTPLTVISSSVGILKTFAKKLSDEQKLVHLNRIETYVGHTTKLLDEILLLNQAEAGKLQFKPTLIDLVSFCENLVNEMQLGASDHNLVFTYNSTADNTVATVDEKLLRQVLTNLLSNAIKYSPDGGEVNFTLALAEDEAVFKVKDSGIGIPPEDQKRLFESFHRAKNVGTIQGTGLGLSIVKKCAQLHGGDVTVESEVGKGTTFTVIIPFVNC
jgi:signal transduction histidine kinase/F0F1-type ATP synthase epsilon subunit